MSEKITFTIASIRPPKEGQKSGMITTTNGDKLWLWRDKLGLVKEGATYEAQAEQNGTFTNLKTVKQVAGPVVALPVSNAAPPRQAASAAGSAPFRSPEQMFVQGVLEAYIANGRCEPPKLTETIMFIRQAYNRNWGGPNGDGRFDRVPYDQAAE